jgi:DNA-nicking Smr family endonuclease
MGRKASKKVNELDLHGFRHREVQSALDPFIFEHMRKGTQAVVIVTGNSEGMKSEVRRVLLDYGITPEEKHNNSGALVAWLI